MRPNLLDGDDVVVTPAEAKDLQCGDIVLAENAEGLLVHRVSSSDSASGKVILRSDTGIDFDPPVTRVFGRVLSLRRSSQEEPLTPLQTRFVHPLRGLFRRVRAAAVLRLRRAQFFLFGILALFLLCVTFVAPTAYAQADLALTQTASVTAVAGATNYSYTDVVINNGPNAVPANTLVVYQQTPPNTTFQSITATNWTCSTPAANGTGPIICTFNNALASGSSPNNIVITEQVNTGTAAGTTILNSATVTSQTVDANPVNNTSVTSIIVESTTTADLAISMTAFPTPVFVISNLTYTIQVQNLGQLTLSSVANVFSDAIPTGATLVSFTAPTGWTCSGSATVQCGLTGSFAMGATATFTITVTAPTTAATLTNTAQINLPITTDPNTLNNTATVITVVQPLVCATPGKDGAGGTLSTVVNAYYPPSTTGTLAAGSTSVALGASSGATKAIAAGDLLLVIQLQGAAINDTNTSSYGDGFPGDPANGSTSLQGSGNFEFVTATSAVATTGGTLQFTGTGTTGGLLNNYYHNAATATQGQQTYQVIRVPQYTSATLAAGLAPLAWTGTVGGVLAIDVSAQLTLGGPVAADYLGFRGGGGRILAGGAGTNTDYVTLATVNADASKGEGIAGTPRYLAPATITTATTATNTGVEGLPNGSYSRGAPGSAGGGGTDGNPAANNENSGGGAGGNGGTGGLGGYGWNSFTALNSTNGGFGGAAFPATTSSLVMGGGGGAGTTNDGSYYISGANHGADCGANCTGIYSSGGAGGGIIIVHTGSITGTGTITSDGQSTLSTDNDSTGGGGAGGSILFYANSGNLNGLTVNANGGSAGSAWPETAPGAFSGARHGPGGGGGGGVILLSGSPTASSVLGGKNGNTDTVQDSYGATPGQAGIVQTTHVITETPGTQPGAYCASADLAVTNSASPLVVAPGGTITYTQGVSNGGPFDAVNAVFSESIPANTTFQSISTVTGWTCVTPAVGSSGTITCSNPDFANGGTGTFTVGVQVSAATPSGTQIVDVDTITSGTSDPNLANNSATVTTTVATATQADLAVTNTAAPTSVAPGSNVTMTAVVSNNGPAAAASAVFTESIPTSTTLGVAFTAPTGWTCNSSPNPIPVGFAGTISCTDNTAFAANASVNFPIVLTVTAGTASGTIISATANISSSTPDPNSANNSSTATATVAAAGTADLAVSSSGTPNPVSPGGKITYTQSITNNGPAAITASLTTTVTFTDAIPTNTTLAVAFTAPAGWTCNSSPIPVGFSGTISCNLNSGTVLNVGAVVNFPMVVQVAASTPLGTTITNSPNISSTVTDPVPGNNTVNVNTLVASPTQAYLTITKTASPEPVDQGTNLVYSINVHNAGPAVAQNVVVTDPIQSQVTYSSVYSTMGTCTYTAPNVSCSLGNIGVGGTAIITVNVAAVTFSSSGVDCPGYPPLPQGVGSCNTATLTSSTSDANPVTSSSFGSTIQSPSAVELSSFRAFSQTDGTVRLVWRTQEESRNLGFHLYRDDAWGRRRIDPSLIAGSALLLRGSRPQHAAKVYAAIDSQPTSGAAYWIEDLDINGTRTIHGPVYPEGSSYDSHPSPSQAQTTETLKVSPSLNQLYPATPSAIPSKWPITPRPIQPTPPVNIPVFNAAGHLSVKISVDQEGWYHVPFSQLFSAGLTPNTDLRSLHLYAEGIEQPLLLSGHTSGIASPSDAIEFYGTGIDTPFSATRIYWLVAEGAAGKRIFPANAPASEPSAPASFPFTVVREDRTSYFAALLNGENSDNFFGAIITSDPVDQTLNVFHRDASSSLPITLQISLQGVTDAQQHSVSIQFNGAPVGTVTFLGQTPVSQSFSVDPSELLDGTNTVTLTALNGDNDVSLVQSINLQYMHTYTADGDWLRATANAGTEVRISGFANAQVRVFDITDALNISELTGKIALESGSYGVNVALPAGSPEVRTILALSNDTLSLPLALENHVPTRLDTNRAGADIVIVTHPDFVAQLAPLVRLRESQHHQVSLVTTEQIFDEFNYGERSPFAVRSFLQFASSQWQRKPQAVLLVGDASMDPRNYLGFGDFDLVPTRIIETAAFKTASDDWLTDFQQTGFATLPTGRLPVRTTADVDLLVSRIVNYEQGEYSGGWNNQAVLIADQNIDANFTAAATAAAAILPSSLNSTQILADGADPTTVHAQIVSALNNGALLVDYNGHGAEQQWSFADIFDDTDASALTNGGHLPVYLLMDCLNGLLQDVYAETLAKSLILAPNGGAIAVWASSGLTKQPPQASLNLAFLHQMAAEPKASLGRLILDAKAGTTDSDVRRTWILFGDPAMKFHFTNSSSASNSAPESAAAQNSPHACPREAACAKEK
jgi:uncharacterized repeat protein (TIGR01451 family)